MCDCMGGRASEQTREQWMRKRVRKQVSEPGASSLTSPGGGGPGGMFRGRGDRMGLRPLCSDKTFQEALLSLLPNSPVNERSRCTYKAPFARHSGAPGHEQSSSHGLLVTDRRQDLPLSPGAPAQWC